MPRKYYMTRKRIEDILESEQPIPDYWLKMAELAQAKRAREEELDRIHRVIQSDHDAATSRSWIAKVRHLMPHIEAIKSIAEKK